MGLSRPSPQHQHSAPNDRPAPDSAADRHRLHLVRPDQAAEFVVPRQPLPDDVVPDDSLIAALVAGETVALGALYDRHATVVFSLLMRILGDRSSAEDLLQDVFLRAWQQAATFDEARGTVRSWLHCIAHTLALNELRRRRRRPQLIEKVPGDAADADDAYAGCVDPAPDPAEDACCAVRDAAVAHALAQLPPAQREVLLLYAAGFSQSEIAAKLDAPLGTVKSRMRRALCQLRQGLSAIGIDDGWPVD
jgi:RNA polymerase sigma-70 factor (ECF subfamily)